MPDYRIEDGRVVARTIDLAAMAVGVNRRTYLDWLKKGCPGERGSYPIPDAVEWSRANVWKAADGGDGGADSPWLEKTREERAKLLQMERHDRERRTVDRAALGELLAAAAGRVREAGGALRRRFGNEAAGILEEALDDAIGEVEAAVAAPADPDGPGLDE